MDLSRTSDLATVIVPMYNHARYIEQCLDSVYNEDYPNIELIIIDDGSKDLSFEIAKNWRASHPGKFHRFHIEKQKNQGVCKTLNRLVSISEGEYIVLLASDDYLLKGGIKAKICALKKKPQLLAVCGDAILVDSEGNVICDSAINYYKLKRKALTDSKYFKRLVIMKWVTPFQTMVLKKKAFDPVLGVGKYDEDIAYEDRDMSLRLLSLSQESYGFVDFPCYAYRTTINQSYSDNIKFQEKILSAKYYSHFSGLDRLYMQINYQTYLHRKNLLYNYILKVIVKTIRLYCQV